MPWFAFAIVAIWAFGALLRVKKQARFYQIEEYKSGRYLRWCLADVNRLVPQRVLTLAGIGLAFTFVVDSLAFNLLPFIIAGLAAAVAIIPPDEGEIKKRFNPTDRAKRLLAASYAVVLALALLGCVLLATVESGRALALGAQVIGLALFLGAPLWLVLGNALMTPVEALLRQNYIRQAKRILAEVNPTVIGITGSYGKTSTKTYLAHILNGRYKAYPTPKSYNTLMGVCIAINNDLANDYSVDYFISEMGAYIPGEIARICDLTPPDISIVVEVGPQHLERFGSLANIAIAKYEIIRKLKPTGLGIFNWDNPYVREMYERGYPQNRIAVSKTLDPHAVPVGGPRFIASDIQESWHGLRFTITDVQSGQAQAMTTPIVGEHNVMNILLAAAVAVHEGMSLAEVAARVRVLQPAESRLVRQTLPNGLTIINDAYSANPVGIVSALRVLGMHPTGRRAVITPGMIELADMHESENRKLGEVAAQYASDIVLVGEKQTAPIRAGVLASGFPPERLLTVATLSEAVQWYQTTLGAGDAVLFLNDLPDTYTQS